MCVCNKKIITIKGTIFLNLKIRNRVNIFVEGLNLKWGEKDRMIEIKKNGKIDQINLDDKEAVKKIITDINIPKIM